jgi:hypothetical protein
MAGYMQHTLMTGCTAPIYYAGFRQHIRIDRIHGRLSRDIRELEVARDILAK